MWMLGKEPRSSAGVAKVLLIAESLLHTLTLFLSETESHWNLLCIQGWPPTHRKPSASVSSVLELKMCATMPATTITLQLEKNINKL